MTVDSYYQFSFLWRMITDDHGHVIPQTDYWSRCLFKGQLLIYGEEVDLGLGDTPLRHTYLPASASSQMDADE